MVSQPGLLKAVKELKSITSSGRRNRQTLRRSNTCVSTLQPSTTVYSATAVRLQTWQSSGDSAVFRRIDVSPRAVQCSTSSFSHLWRLEHPHRWQRQRVCHETQWTIADIRPRPTHPRANTCSRPHSRHIVISRSDTVVQQLSVGDFVSDHAVVNLNLNLRRSASTRQLVTRRSWRNFIAADFEADLAASRLCADQRSLADLSVISNGEQRMQAQCL